MSKIIKSYQNFVNESKKESTDWKWEFGLEHKSNVAKAKKALKAAGIEFKADGGTTGTTYFNFKTKSDLNKAVREVKKVITTAIESEWMTAAEEKAMLKDQAENNPK